MDVNDLINLAEQSVQAGAYEESQALSLLAIAKSMQANQPAVPCGNEHEGRVCALETGHKGLHTDTSVTWARTVKA